MIFLSTLSLRRATLISMLNRPNGKFLSTLSLRRATCLYRLSLITLPISIHALLAESDKRAEIHASSQQEFLSTLSLRRATQTQSLKIPPLRISIHALLAESD